MTCCCSAYGNVGIMSGRYRNLMYDVRPTKVILARRRNDVVWFTGLLPILHRFRDIAFDRSKIAIFGYPCCVECRRWRSSLHHIMVSDTSLKLETMRYISVVETLRISLTTFMQCAAKAIEFAEIAQTNDHYTPFKVIQGHRFWYQSKAHLGLPVSD